VIAEDRPGAGHLAGIPEPDGERLIGVRAAEVSFPDLLMTRSGYQIRQPLPFTLGTEAAGLLSSRNFGSLLPAWPAGRDCRFGFPGRSLSLLRIGLRGRLLRDERMGARAGLLLGRAAVLAGHVDRLCAP
jgi:hypothetical protein